MLGNRPGGFELAKNMVNVQGDVGNLAAAFKEALGAHDADSGRRCVWIMPTPSARA